MRHFPRLKSKWRRPMVIVGVLCIIILLIIVSRLGDITEQLERINDHLENGCDDDDDKDGDQTKKK
jgi:hypothetical protein